MHEKEKFGLQNENKIIKSTSCDLPAYSRTLSFLSLPTYGSAVDLSHQHHAPPAATKPFVRACLFLRTSRVRPCLDSSDSDSRCLSSSLGGKMLASCLAFIQFAFVPPADHFPVSLCLSSFVAALSIYHATRHVFSFLNSFSICVVQLSTCFFSFFSFSPWLCLIFVAHLSGFAFYSSFLFW